MIQRSVVGIDDSEAQDSCDSDDTGIEVESYGMIQDYRFWFYFIGDKSGIYRSSVF